MFLLTGLTALPALGIKASVTEMKSNINLTTSSNKDDKPDLEIIYLDIFRLKQEKPEGFPKIMEMLGDADIMGCGYEENNGRAI